MNRNWFTCNAQQLQFSVEILSTDKTNAHCTSFGSGGVLLLKLFSSAPCKRLIPGGWIFIRAICYYVGMNRSSMLRAVNRQCNHRHVIHFNVNSFFQQSTPNAFWDWISSLEFKRPLANLLGMSSNERLFSLRHFADIFMGNTREKLQTINALVSRQVPVASPFNRPPDTELFRVKYWNFRCHVISLVRISHT